MRAKLTLLGFVLFFSAVRVQEGARPEHWVGTWATAAVARAADYTAVRCQFVIQLVVQLFIQLFVQLVISGANAAGIS